MKQTLPNVLMAVHVFPSKGGGRIEKLVKLLPERGFQPVIISPKETQSVTARHILETIVSQGTREPLRAVTRSDLLCGTVAGQGARLQALPPAKRVVFCRTMCVRARLHGPMGADGRPSSRGAS